MLESFSRLQEERNDLVARLDQSEKTVVDLVRQVEELSDQRNQARGRLDGLLSRLEKMRV